MARFEALGSGFGLRLRGLVRRPFASLPSRIITLVFSAALVTSAAVTWTATSATELFLRRQIGQRFPAALERVAERIDLWYGQREHDLDTFSHSETIVGSLDSSERGRAEARRYLAYVQEGFPQYRALFMLDESGNPVVWVGKKLEIPASLRASLSRVDGTHTGSVHRIDGDMVQFVSTPLIGPAGRKGSLHAMLAVDSLDRLIAGDEVPRSGRVLVVGEDGQQVVAQVGEEPTQTAAVPHLAAGTAGVLEYADARGERWVGSVHHLDRFDWNLVVEEPYEQAFAPVVAVIRNTLAINFAIVLVFGGIALLIARSIVRPIRALSDRARLIAQGETQVELPVASGQDELAVLSRALREMVARLQRNQLELEREKTEKDRANDELRNKNEELRRGNELLEQLSFTDGLTRLHNHRYFQDRLRVEVRRSDRTGEQLALLLVDIDDFKALNDRHGHAVGDQVLRQVGSVLNESVREADLPARYGGEEFVVLAPHTGKVGALALAEKLRGAISRSRFDCEGTSGASALQVTVSIGVSVYGGDARRLFNDADRALYQAKATGKDCVVFVGDVDAEGD
ncbi:MAG TPA: diguanylate cyclase [Myxococcota bacterium]|nr:diguanylate cyclase [Myxococcota bacterium]